MRSAVLSWVLYKDENIAVIAKPPGLATHPSPLCPDRDTCLSRLRKQLGLWVYPVHRLDKPTSGVLVFALSPLAARVLNEAFTKRSVHKTYTAVVRGYLDEHGEITKPLRESPDHPLQDALTSYYTLAHAEAPWGVGRFERARYSLVSLSPTTGRMHQLRKHLCGISHPIIGDTQRGDGAHNRAFRHHLGINRLLLHATTLELPSSVFGSAQRFDAPFDNAFQDAMRLFDPAE